ncbi:MAG: hypothetical protein NXI00_12260 [Cytophagales bacterium]|nr:hypothetical protein [Cytophagales bacterium]
MTESELIIKVLEDAYTFIKKQVRTTEKDELLIDLFKAKILVNNLTIHSVVKSFVCNSCQSTEEKKLTDSTSQCKKCDSLQAN